MNAFKITFADGYNISTSMNANIDEAKDYYIGKYFNFGIEGDVMKKAVSVEQIAD